MLPVLCKLLRRVSPYFESEAFILEREAFDGAKEFFFFFVLAGVAATAVARSWNREAPQGMLKATRSLAWLRERFRMSKRKAADGEQRRSSPSNGRRHPHVKQAMRLPAEG
jgi:hypothetical protein